MKHIIFTDLDLTIYPECKIMPENTIKYLNDLANQGNIVVLCTGRPYTGSLHIYNLFSDNLILACDNGTRILKPNDPTFKKITAAIDMNEFNKVFSSIIDGVHMSLCIDENNIYGYKLNNAPGWMFHTLPHTKIYDSENFPCLISEDISLINLDVLESHNNKFLSLIEKCKNIKCFSWGFRDGHYSYEIFSKEGDKSFAVKKISELYSNEDIITYAFGDQLNDIPMIKEANVGVAMINGSEIVKEAADFITEYDCDNEGVIHFLKKKI